MSHRSPSPCRFWIGTVAFVAATGGAASVGHAQRASGSIGASLTILAPVAAPPIRVSEFAIGPDGIARIETRQDSARAPWLVMSRVSGATTGSTQRQRPRMRVAPSSGATRTRYLVDVGRDQRAGLGRPAELHVEYLIVAAGT